MPNQYPGNTTLSQLEQNYYTPQTGIGVDNSRKFFDYSMGYQNTPNYAPTVANPNYGSMNATAYNGGMNPIMPNPIYNNYGSMGNLFAGNGGNGGGGSNGFSASSLSDMFNSFSGGGNVDFNSGTPEGYNPYQFMPTFSGLERPSSPVAGLEPEQEYLRQQMMGQLLGEHPGEDLAYDEAYSTVAGDYMHPDSNPYMTELINALGDDTSSTLNRGINDILSRAGVGGALGGSRAALMQGQAVGDATRAQNTNVSSLLNANYQNERTRQLDTIPTLTSLENAPIQRAGQAYDLASIPQQLKQKLIDAQREELLRQQNERLQPLQVGQSILGQRMGQTVPIVQQQASSLSGLGNLFSGLGGLATGVGNLNSRVPATTAPATTSTGGGGGGGGTNNWGWLGEIFGGDE